MSKVEFYDAVDVISGGTPKTTEPNYWNGDIDWLSIVDFGSCNKYVYKTEKTITEEGLKNSNTKLLEKDDIIFSARGTVGAMAMLAKPMAFNQSCFGLRAKPEVVNPHYLFYYLKYYMKGVKSKTQGSVFETINLDTFKMINLEIPPLSEQRPIADLLSFLDSKIETNNAIISELESMVKDIYDYWFVQFDFPDENGKPYKSSGGKMVWNEELKREIPEGWKANYISNLVSLKNGINYDKANQGTGKEYQIINVRNISNSSLCIDKSKLDKIILPPTNANRYLIEKNSILIARSGIPGAIRIIDIDESSNIIFCGFIILCTPNNPDYMLYYLYSLKKYEGTNATKTGGSILQNVSQDTIGSLCILIPENTIVERFNSIIEPIHKRIMNALEENAELASLRDFLLPLLMNGQVKIGEGSD